MRDSAVDVTVKTRFASAEALMQVVSSGIERGALRLPTQLPIGRTFEVALLTAAGELAIRGSCEALRADGEATLVRFLSATDDGENRDAWVDLDDALVTMSPTMAAECLLRPRGRDRSDWAGALGTPMPPSTPGAAARVAIPPRPTTRAGGTASPTPPTPSRPRREVAAGPRAATLPLEPPASNAPVPPPRPAPRLEPAVMAPSTVVVDTPMVAASPPMPTGTTVPPPMPTGTTVPPPMPTGTTMPPPMMAMWGTPAGYYLAPAGYDASARMRPTTLPPGWGPDQGRMWIPVVDPATVPAPAPVAPVAAAAPPSRAARGMLAASVFIAAAGAAVAVSAVWWARSVSAQRPAPAPAASVATASAPNAPPPVTAPVATAAAPVAVAAGPREPAAPPPSPPDLAPTAPEPVVAPVAVEPEPAAPAIDVAPETLRELPPPRVADTRCPLTVTSNADGAAIFVDGHRRGEVPATIDVPCAATEITLRHSRYQEQVRTLVPTEQPTLHLTLSRPRAQLRVVSRPSGATVKIGGRVVGKAPLVAPVDGFERVSVTLSGPGLATETRSVYAKGGSNVLAVTMKKK